MAFSLWVLGALLLFSALGVILFRKPIYASLSFLLTLFLLAVLYLQLSAEFIAVMQILVYAGAILVVFVFVIVLFQDAYQQIAKYQAESAPLLIRVAGALFILALIAFGTTLTNLPVLPQTIPDSFGSVHGIGRALYLDFFFPFEAVIALFLVALIGTIYIAKKEPVTENIDYTKRQK